MNNTVTYLYPAPWSPLPLAHPARGYTQADDTDVAKTWREHMPVHAPHQVGDDYDAVERSAHLDLPGEFK